jgi:hypothetical protein
MPLLALDIFDSLLFIRKNRGGITSSKILTKTFQFRSGKIIFFI